MGCDQEVTTTEPIELAAARNRIRELETELKVMRRANELLKVWSTKEQVRGRRHDRERGPPG